MNRNDRLINWTWHPMKDKVRISAMLLSLSFIVATISYVGVTTATQLCPTSSIQTCHKVVLWTDLPLASAHEKPLWELLGLELHSRLWSKSRHDMTAHCITAWAHPHVLAARWECECSFSPDGHDHSAPLLAGKSTKTLADDAWLSALSALFLSLHEEVKETGLTKPPHKLLPFQLSGLVSTSRLVGNGGHETSLRAIPAGVGALCPCCAKVVWPRRVALHPGVQEVRSKFRVAKFGVCFCRHNPR